MTLMKIIRIHWIAIILSMVVGATYASHHFFISALLDYSKQIYYPITTKTYYDEAVFYAPRAHAAFLGQWIVGDFGLGEYPRGPSILPILNPIVLGKLGLWAGSMRTGLMVSDFLFPAIIFLIIYFLVWEITSRRIPALLFSSLFIFVPKFGIYIPPVSFLNLRELIKSALPFLQTEEVLHFSQFEEPKITFLFMSLCFYLIYRTLKRNEHFTVYIAGISFGLLFYTYLYDWASILVALVIMGVIFLFQKDYSRAKQIVVIVGVGALVSSFYWYNLWQILHLPNHQDIIARAGGEFSHHIRFFTVWKSYLRAIVLVVALWLFWYRSCPKRSISAISLRKRLFGQLLRREKNIAIFLSAFLLAYFVVVNAQIITGFNPHPDHWYRVQFFPIALTIFLLGLRFFNRYFNSSFLYAFFFLLYFYAAVFYSQVMYSIKYADAYGIDKDKIASYEWLNKHVPQGAAVGSILPSINWDIQLHTHHKPFLPFGFSTLASDKELWERFMITSKIFGVSPQKFASVFMQNSMGFYLFNEEYGSHDFDSSFRSYKRKIPDSLVEEKTNSYSEYSGSSSFGIPYRLDYLYFSGENSDEQDPVKSIPNLSKVYENGKIKIYQWFPKQ